MDTHLDLTANSGVADVLQHVEIDVMSNRQCQRRWQFQSILGTHICVGGGTESACNVSITIDLMLTTFGGFVIVITHFEIK